ncbi:hypothetical protein [Allokutzneria sp. NRRL B-24872]|uniref:hypothetical protein n=1 Tax=Allokutzneria sp. NRRL B-24872 TaxID=1137961 RepID=UPI000A3B0D88|nr:hypothetical protein [Allokutzneria sp. NRRL B-24872]
MGRVLLIGLDPATIPEWDPVPVLAALARGHARFERHGIEFDECLLAMEEIEDADDLVVRALSARDYACVVIGGGIRMHAPLLEFFEKLVNLVRLHAPGAAIAFNSNPEDSADAALRWLR